MKIELNDKEIKSVGMNRYLKRIRKLFFILVVSTFIEAVIAMLIVERNSPLALALCIIGLIEVILIFYLINYKGWKEGKKFLEKCKQEQV